MHHPTLFAKRAEKQGSLNWLTAPTIVNNELWLNNSAQWCVQLSCRHACPLLGIAPRLFTQVSSSLLAVREIKISFSAVALRLSYLKWQFFSHDVMDPTCAFQEHWNLFWNDVHAVYLSLLQKYLIRFHRKESFRPKEPQLKSLPNADNNWLKQIPCEVCNRYDWYRCVSRILKNKKNGKVHSSNLQSPQSTTQHCRKILY